MACTCKKTPCCCGGNDGGSAELSNALAQLADLQEEVGSIKTSLGGLLDGHPIIALEEVTDIALFDLGSGIGSGRWQNWGVCNGNQYPVPGTTAKITTPNLIDRVLVGATGNYAIDDVFGADDITLTVAQLPEHNHGVTDPGHTHVINDPGHDHPVTDPGHSHGAAGEPHTHTLTIDDNGTHNHSIPEPVDAVSNGGTGAFAMNDPVSYGNSGNAGLHSHSGVADDAAVSVTVQDAFTGIDVTDAFTGISNDPDNTGITIDNEGNGDSIDIRPKSYAVLFVMKIY